MIMTMTTQRIQAVASEDGLTINGHVFNKKLPLECYRGALGLPSHTIDAGPPAPAGYRNNQVHVFDSAGIYLTEHHASRLIESVNFVFDPADSPFPIAEAFPADLTIDGRPIHTGMSEDDLDRKLFARDLSGEFSVKFENCWVGLSAKERRNSNGKQEKPRFVIRASVCF